jgi:hypothetical protein
VLPWYAWLVGVLFWTLVLVKWRTRGRGGSPGQVSELTEDSPRWAHYRNRGF